MADAAVAEDIARGCGSPAGPVTHVQQLVAAATHSMADRLGEIAAATLVVHGTRTPSSPAVNATQLAESIRTAAPRLAAHRPPVVTD
jgi:hypothetical protein